MRRSQVLTSGVCGVAALALATAAFAQDGATIKGKVIFEGDANKREYRRTRIDTSKDPNCARVKKAIGSWSVILNRRDDPVTIRNVMVFVEEGLGDRKFDPPSEPVVLDQQGCEYTPHVLGIVEGQALRIKNSDPTNHNIHFLPEKNPEINFTQPKQNMTRDVTLSQEAPFKVKCDVHPWMGAYIAVFQHPFFDVTGEEGTFALEGLPPGKYVLTAWHETFGTQTATVEVASDEAKELNFTFAPDK